MFKVVLLNPLTGKEGVFLHDTEDDAIDCAASIIESLPRNDNTIELEHSDRHTYVWIMEDDRVLCLYQPDLGPIIEYID